MELLIPEAADLAEPARCLALDEVALDFTEDTGREFFWTWESPRPWVVVGLGQSVAQEVELESCQRAGCEVFRRCSGGGAVVQGPGCLNYAVTLVMDRASELASVTTTNLWVMSRLRTALQRAVDGDIAIHGHTDLAWWVDGGWRKFSGNAQRRRRRALLFHGTLLHSFDLSLLGRCLRHPSAEPAYRGGRSHLGFVTNLAVPAAELRESVRAAWPVERPAEDFPAERVGAVAAARYRLREWNYRK
jgi:lipoate-protein ligase A